MNSYSVPCRALVPVFIIWLMVPPPVWPNAGVGIEHLDAHFLHRVLRRGVGRAACPRWRWARRSAAVRSIAWACRRC